MTTVAPNPFAPANGGLAGAAGRAPWESPGYERKAIVVGLGAIVVFLVGTLFWVMVAPLHGAVVADGTVRNLGNRKTLQHLEGGIIKDILVKDGDRVVAGQELLVLEDIRVAAGKDQLLAQLDGERLREARLEAEVSLRRQFTLPASQAAPAGAARQAEVRSREIGLFKARQDSLARQTALLKVQIVEADAETAALAKQITAADAALSAVKAELASAQALAAQGFIQKTRVLNLERDLSQQTAAVESVRAELAKARQKRTDTELRLVSTRQSYVQQASDELKDSTARRIDLEERVRPLVDARTRQSVVAPVAGTVVDLRVFTVGAAVAPREPLLDIVPSQGELVVEAKVRAEDINDVKMGGVAEVRFTSLKARSTPMAKGAVKYVSADRLVDKAGTMSFFTVQVSVPKEELDSAGGITLTPGMPAEVFMRTEQRNAVQYLVDPITERLRRGMRER